MKKIRKPNVFTKLAESVWGVSETYLSRPPLNKVRKAAIAVFGSTVLLVGIAMIVLPGPAIVFIPLGLAILGTEFLWARRLLKRLQHQAQKVKNAYGAMREKRRVKGKGTPPGAP